MLITLHLLLSNWFIHFCPTGLRTSVQLVYALLSNWFMTFNLTCTLLCTVFFQENYGCEIFTCLNPTGTIAPGKTALIHWVFEPLEAKTYVVSDTSTVFYISFLFNMALHGHKRAISSKSAAALLPGSH